MEILHTENVNGYRLNIMQDIEPESPRDWDNVGTMVAFHGRYTLGDTDHGYDTPQALEDFLKTFDGVSLPLYLYDHSGITINTSPFACRFDSGQIGHIYATMEDIKKTWDGTPAQLKVKATACLVAEVIEYDHYLTGNVYGYDILEICGDCGHDTESIESCWGFYGMEYCKDYARASIPKKKG